MIDQRFMIKDNPNNGPRISIVTPSFNQGKYIEETIKSVLGQTYQNFEYIVIDGGSTDGSVDIIRRYEDRLRYWCSENDRGQSDAIMKGFELCTGELFAWINSDDVLFPRCLEAIAECYLSNNRPDIVYTNVCYIDSKSRITRFVRVPRQSRFFFYRGVWHCSAPTIFFRSASFREAGGLNLSLQYVMDLDLWMRLMDAGVRIANDPRCLGAFRRHEESKSAQYLNGKSEGWSEEVRKVYKNYKPELSHRKRKLWKSVYKLYQVVNMNYIRAYFSGKSVAYRNWKKVFCPP